MSSDLNPKVPQAMDLAALRAKLAQENGKRFWQSLEELSETKEYREFLENEFPHDPAKDPRGSESPRRAEARRCFGGSGRAERLHQAAHAENCPVREGARGNYSGQAALLRHVHAARRSRQRPAGRKPHGPARRRSKAIPSIPAAWAARTCSRRPRRWGCTIRTARKQSCSKAASAAGPRSLTAMGNEKAAMSADGSGLRILTDTVTSPTLAAQIAALLKKLPAAKWHQYEPCGRDNAREGATPGVRQAGEHRVSHGPGGRDRLARC